MSSDDRMTDEEFIASIVRAREESVRFFEAENRAERELWVVSQFLTNLGIQFQNSELTHVTDDPPDVLFRDANFEVKEIMDEGRRRHGDFKQALERAKGATSPRDLMEQTTPRDITYTDACMLVRLRVDSLSRKYSKGTRETLDLLFYLNLEDVYGYIPTDLPTASEWTSYGFRSVSLLMGRLAGVLAVDDGAPKFLGSGGVRIVRASRSEE